MAAGCIYALENNIERLAIDHQNAALLAGGLARIPGLRVINPQPHTNMVFFETEGCGLTPNQFLERLQKQGVNMSAIEQRVRAVTHLGVSREDCLQAIEVVQQVISAYSASPS